MRTDLSDFEGLLSKSDLREIPVDLDTFLFDDYYLGNLKIKKISDTQRLIIEQLSQVFKEETLIEIHGEEKGREIWNSTVNEVVAMAGKGSGKDFSSRLGFAYAIYKIHCLTDPITYYDKSHGTYIDMLNIAVNAEQANNVFFAPLKNMLSMSPFFTDNGFEPRKSSLEFYSAPIRVHSGNSEAEAWEGLDLMLVVLDEIAAFKGLGPNTPVLTPSGWVRNADLDIGDEVIGLDGKPTEVVGIFPMGSKETYSVVFEDGASVECSDDHLWTVNEYSDDLGKSTKTLPLKDFKSVKVGDSQYRYSIPVVSPVEFTNRGDLPVDPYLLGILIAEGSMTNDSLRFYSEDQFIVEEVIKRIPNWLEVKSVGSSSYKIYGKNNVIKNGLKDLGLWGRRSHSKFIPEKYLYASIDDRKLLLAGLMDGDRTYARDHGSYTTVSRQLKDDFIELCRGLGGIPMASKHGSWHRDEMRESVDYIDRWEISPGLLFNPFMLPRKADRWTPHKSSLSRSITSIEKTGLAEEMTCIKVANNDGLYVIKDYVVTHNTDSSFQKANAQGAQRLSASAIYRMSKASVMSRFPNVGKVILLSFPRYANDFICQRYDEAGDESDVLRIKAPTWVMNPFITREMLEPEFKRNPIDSAQRFGCEPPLMTDAYFREPDRVRKCFKGIWEVKNKGEPDESLVLRENRDLHPIADDGTFKPWFKADDDHTRFIHVDLALKRDRAALAMCHSPGVRKVEVEHGVFENLPVVKMDIVHYWEAKPGYEIDFQQIREFVKTLAVRFPVGLVTLDRWNSVDTIQILNKRGIRTEAHSVKKSDYDTLSTAMYDGRFSGYFHHMLVEDELLRLQILDNGKIDHPDGFHDDLAQAVASATWHACEYADLDGEIDISILGQEEDWEYLEYAEAMEEDQIARDGRRSRERETMTYDEDEMDFGIYSI